jgi:hypothetical protein
VSRWNSVGVPIPSSRAQAVSVCVSLPWVMNRSFAMFNDTYQRLRRQAIIERLNFKAFVKDHPAAEAA